MSDERYRDALRAHNEYHGIETPEPAPVPELYHRVAGLLDEAVALRDRHRREWEVLFERARQIQRTCPHEHTHYHGDACGGQDSFTRCEECGAEQTRWGWTACPGVVEVRK